MSEVCTFCHFMEDGDCPDNHGVLLDQLVSINNSFNTKYESISTNGGIFINGKVEIGIRVLADVWTPHKAINIALSTGDDYSDFIDLEAQITYCPMCGRKL